MTEDSPVTTLSAAGLWERQRRFFIDEGERVWRDGIVPSYVSTNPFLGGFLAEMLSAYVAEAGGPVDVIELGGGSGQLAFHVLRGLGASVPVRYVLTDLAPTMLDFWRHHPRLAPFVAAGVLDFAEFDVSRPGPLRLTESGDVLFSAGAPSFRPVAVLASYCFDSVPQDLFAVDESGTLSELVLPVSDRAEPGEDGWPEDATLAFERRPCSDERYGDADLDAILSGYRSLGRAALVSFPITALECLAYLADRSPGGLLALVGDRGFTNPEDSEVLSVVEPTRHGSVSLPVNFHALGEWFLRRGGAACHPDHRARSFNVSMFALPGSPGSPTAPWPRTEAAYRAGAATRDPDTFFTVKKAVQAQYDSLSVPEAIAFLRLSHWDADIFDALFLHLVERLSSEPLDDGGRRELVAAVGHVWEGYYPVRDNDLAFKVGSVLYAAGAYREALTFFDRSLAANDAAVDAWLNRAVCHHMLGERDEALACVGRALELAPGLDQAVTLLQDLLA